MNNACVVFLIEEAPSMQMRIAEGTHSKIESIATAINSAIRQMEGRSPIDVALLGYRRSPDGGVDIGSRFGGIFEGRVWVSSDELVANPIRVEVRTKQMVNPVTRSVTPMTVDFPVWYEPKLGPGNMDHLSAYEFLAQTLQSWVESTQPVAPPMIFSFLRDLQPGESIANAVVPLGQVSTPQGFPQLLQFHAGTYANVPAIKYPTVPQFLPYGVQELFFACSPLSESMIASLRQNQEYPAPGAKGLIYNGRMIDMVRMLDFLKFYQTTLPTYAPTVPASTTKKELQTPPGVIPPTNTQPTNTQPTSIPSTSVPPVGIQPATIPSTSVPSTSVPSTSVPPVGIQPASVQPTSVSSTNTVSSAGVIPPVNAVPPISAPQNIATPPRMGISPKTAIQPATHSPSGMITPSATASVTPPPVKLSVLPTATPPIMKPSATQTPAVSSPLTSASSVPPTNQELPEMVSSGKVAKDTEKETAPENRSFTSRIHMPDLLHHGNVFNPIFETFDDDDEVDDSLDDIPSVENLPKVDMEIIPAGFEYRCGPRATNKQVEESPNLPPRQTLLVLLVDRSISSLIYKPALETWERRNEKTRFMLGEIARRGRGRYDTALIFYGKERDGSMSAFSGALGRTYLPDNCLAESAGLVELTTIHIPNGIGGLISLPRKRLGFADCTPTYPADPTPGFQRVVEIIKEWDANRQNKILPPVVLHITSGKFQMDKLDSAMALLSDSELPPVLLHHWVFTERPHTGVCCPGSDDFTTDTDLLALWERSDALPAREILAGVRPGIHEESRGMMVNMDFDVLFEVLDTQAQKCSQNKK